jgi:hypothetical protein
MSGTVPFLGSAAILVWMPPGAEPTAAAFDLRNVQPPPVPNPEAWWTLGDALDYAVNLVTTGANHGKDPWIKVGDALLNPPQVHIFHNTRQALKGVP